MGRWRALAYHLPRATRPDHRALLRTFHAPASPLLGPFHSQLPPFGVRPHHLRRG